jgi:hypothetical protein
MAAITLDDDDVERIADLVAERILERIEMVDANADRWLGTTEAADYLGITTNALHKLTAARQVPFEQDRPRARCWFKAAALDEWRRGR